MLKILYIVCKQKLRAVKSGDLAAAGSLVALEKKVQKDWRMDNGLNRVRAHGVHVCTHVLYFTPSSQLDTLRLSMSTGSDIAMRPVMKVRAALY